MHLATTCMEPNGGIKCSRGEGVCVSNMQVVTVYYDQKDLGDRARIADMTPKIISIVKSCSCRLKVGSMCFGQ